MDTASIIFIIAVLVLVGILAIWAVCARQKQVRKMQEDISLGDSVETVGGIRGIVVSFTEAELTIESGGKGSEIIVARSSVTAVAREPRPTQLEK
ncbi:preprotein translocase subunit YajC [Christensenellaceae bacterium OttesenSCG-928-K19]|nr:preprotein translocase subunit YajC [Christensenellaceae bacterium OttesenSCG-928-K19]